VHRANPAAAAPIKGSDVYGCPVRGPLGGPLLTPGCVARGGLSPTAARAVRAVWRTRAHWGRHQTAPRRSLHHSIVRQTGVRLRATRIHAVPLEESERLLPEPEQVLAGPRSLAVGLCLEPQSPTLATLGHTRLQPPRLCAVPNRGGHRDACGPDDWAGNGRDAPLSHGGPGRLLVPLWAEYHQQPWAADRPRQPQQWHPGPWVG
jgi:hypothetical protein